MGQLNNPRSPLVRKLSLHEYKNPMRIMGITGAVIEPNSNWKTSTTLRDAYYERGLDHSIEHQYTVDPRRNANVRHLCAADRLDRVFVKGAQIKVQSLHLRGTSAMMDNHNVPEGGGEVPIQLVRLPRNQIYPTSRPFPSDHFAVVVDLEIGDSK